MSGVTADGYERTRLDDRLAELDAAMRAIFGPDINLDPDTVDGQTMGIFAGSLDDLDQAIADAYNSFNPEGSSGASLSRLVQLNGIRRLGATRSTVTVTLTGTAGTIVPANTIVESTATKARFYTLASATIGVGGTVNAACEAEQLGAMSAPSGTLTKIVTPIFGLASCTNAASAVVGRSEETDPQLRLRRRKSVAMPSQSLLDSIYASVGNLAGVSQVRITENNTNDIDVATGLPPHSMFVCVQGGNSSDIAYAIDRTKSLGVTMVGDVTETVIDSQGDPHPITFARPVDVPIYVVVNVTELTGWPTDGAQRIKDAIVAWSIDNQLISDDVIYSRLYEPINSVPGHSVTGLFIGTSAAPTGEVDIPISHASLASFAEARITVNLS